MGKRPIGTQAFKARRFCLLGRRGIMLMAAASSGVKAKLQAKAAWRPTNMVMRKMPDGTGDLSELPRRRDNAVLGDEAAEEEYCNAVARVASAFGRQKRAVTTAAEHVMYMRMFDGWLVENKHGSVVEVITPSSSNGKSNGLAGRKLVPRRRADGSMKVRADRSEPCAVERV